MRFNMARTWGLEIEFKGNKSAVIRELRNRGIEVADAGYTHRVMNTWKLVSDSSCEWELVSPPMAGEEGFTQLKKACAALNAAGATVDRTCGLHVHHIARDLPALAIRRFLKLYCRYEGIIDTLVAPSRRNNENIFCRSLRSRLSSEAAYANLDSREAENLYAFNGTRYMKVNLESMARYGTVEIRHHQGTLDFQKMKAWIVFTQALLNHAADSRVSNTCKATWEQFKIVIGAVGKKFADETSREAMAYLDRRHRAFTADSGHTARTVVEACNAPMTAARDPRRG